MPFFENPDPAIGEMIRLSPEAASVMDAARSSLEDVSIPNWLLQCIVVEVLYAACKLDTPEKIESVLLELMDVEE